MEYIKQDITLINHGIICHGVNNSRGGVMGAGVALYLRRKYPQIFDNYSILCSGNDQQREDLLGTTDLVKINDDLFVANCFTQTLGDVYPPARVDAIQTSLNIAFLIANNRKLPIYLPQIGCGLGGLSWPTDIEPIVSKLANMFDEVDTYVCIYP